MQDKFKIEYENTMVELDHSVLVPLRYLLVNGSIPIVIILGQITIFEGDLCYQKENSNMIIHEFILDNDRTKGEYSISELKMLLSEYFVVMEHASSVTIRRKDLSILNFLFEYYDKCKKIDFLNIDLSETTYNHKTYAVIIKEQTDAIVKELTFIVNQLYESIDHE